MCKIKNLFCLVVITAFFIFSTISAHAEKPTTAKLNNELISKASFGRAADVEILLEKGASSNALNSANLSALFLAAGRADAEGAKIVAALIKKGADIYKPDPRGNMPIIEAVRSGHPQTVKTLIENKAVVSVKDQNGNDLNKIAEIRGSKEIIAYVKAAILAEQKNLGELTSEENLTKYVQKYSMLSCAYQYLKFYKKENPSKLSNEKYNMLITQNEAESTDLNARMQALFDISSTDLRQIKKTSMQLIQADLDRLLTPENRRYNGFGKNEHLNARCKKIANYWDASRISQTKKNSANNEATTN